MKKDEHLKVLLENVDPPRFGCRIRVLAHEMWKIAVGEIDYDVLVVKCFILWPIHLWWWPKPSMFAADIPMTNHQKLVREPSTWMSVQWPSCIAGGQCLPWIEKKLWSSREVSSSKWYHPPTKGLRIPPFLFSWLFGYFQGQSVSSEDGKCC